MIFSFSKYGVVQYLPLNQGIRLQGLLVGPGFSVLIREVHLRPCLALE
jgi:hypothetical protein